MERRLPDILRYMGYKKRKMIYDGINGVAFII